VELDTAKSKLERNKLGQFATPPILAQELAELASQYLAQGKSKVRLLEPSVGSGSFISALFKAFPLKNVEAVKGVEYDKRFADFASSLWQDFQQVQIISGDFTSQKQKEGEDYNLLIANPPYVRHHHLSRDVKARLKEAVRNELGIEVSGLAGLYSYFLLLSHKWLSDDGLSFWLIPSEFMDVNYGRAVKDYLLNNVELLRIHRFDPSEVQFTDALVSSAVVIFRKRKPPTIKPVEFSYGGSLLKPSSRKEVSAQELADSNKWTPLANDCEHPSKTSSLKLGDLFDVKRGIATGNNSFFILPRSQVEEFEIPSGFVRSYVPSPRYLKDSIIESDSEGFAKTEKDLIVIDCPEGEDFLRNNYPKFWNYLEEGQNQGVDSTYLTSRRTPWYSQEKRPAAPFLCSYMGRNPKKPFRFFWNKSQAIASNVYLLIYPKGDLLERINENPSLEGKVFNELEAISPEDFRREGRVYGGGLRKMEPKELKNLPADRIAEIAGVSTQGELKF